MSSTRTRETITYRTRVRVDIEVAYMGSSEAAFGALTGDELDEQSKRIAVRWLRTASEADISAITEARRAFFGQKDTPDLVYWVSGGSVGTRLTDKAKEATAHDRGEHDWKSDEHCEQCQEEGRTA